MGSRYSEGTESLACRFAGTLIEYLLAALLILALKTIKTSLKGSSFNPNAMIINSIALFCQFSTRWIADISFFAGDNDQNFLSSVFLVGEGFTSLVVAIECYIFIKISIQLKTEILVEEGTIEIKKIRYSAASYADLREEDNVNDLSVDDCDVMRATYELAKS